MTEKLRKLRKQLAYTEKRLDDLFKLRDLMNNMCTEDRRAIGYKYTHKEFAEMSKLIDGLITERSGLLSEIYAIEDIQATDCVCMHVVIIDHGGE